MDWISIKDKLPEKNQKVLLFLENEEKKTVMLVGYIFDSKSKHFEKINGEFVAETGGFPEALKREFVKFWMVLPEEPKEE